ncbi:gamma-glutamyltransferase family protein [Mucisphaera calidilacus]|uniref:Gamma-glutamyltransferase YwrD n=1 Tax=Mucisphaera calidilacus TaxID=2527982 RepID=A0A518BWP4_9BACT|nr:gamma-glutamyltransferase family protein [Mucisphaera calidilacus]QDU71399.1 Putative gamma-glutamyltransferase YwrD [Mucisphaera calidilacus]
MTRPYHRLRHTVYGSAAVASSQPLATAAGLHALRSGGNALDAALATAITLTVVEPSSNGLGSDAFTIIHKDGKLHALNGSGRSPSRWTPDRFAGLDEFPLFGPDSVTVPGVVHAWATAHQRFGKLPFADLFQDAIRHARDGFPVGPITAAAWARGADRYSQRPDWSSTFLTNGKPPTAGQRFAMPDHARTLETIAKDHGQSFYQGELAQRIAAHIQAEGGALHADDLAAHQSDWVDTIHTTAFDRTLHELPPNGQGIAALIALGIARNLPLADLDPDCPDAIHLQAEAIRLAFADLHTHVSDPNTAHIDTRQLLDPDYLKQRAAQVNPRKAGDPAPGIPRRGGTIYCCAADNQGMMVSWIQSNFWGFGSGLVVPDTGIALQNRAAGFTLEPGHANQAAPAKRPFHTIIPGFITNNHQPEAAFGVMGGSFQTQGHLQVFLRRYLWKQDLQEAADAPRWMITSSRKLALEPAWDKTTADDLTTRGHNIIELPFIYFGGAQGIFRQTDNTYAALSDWRKEGQAAVI